MLLSHLASNYPLRGILLQRTSINWQLRQLFCPMQPCSLQSVQLRSDSKISTSSRTTNFGGSRIEQKNASKDPRLPDMGLVIEDEFAHIKNKYRTPKHPIVLCHGLFGFDEIKLAGNIMPGITYWRGIAEALTNLGVDVIRTAVPASGTIEDRAAALTEQIKEKATGREVHLIGHSMGGIDARYLVSRLRPREFRVISLTTVVTPHKGSPFADYVLQRAGKARLYKALESMGMQTGAFNQLTTTYMRECFNPSCPDVENVRYFSYGAYTQPGHFSIFRMPHRIIFENEGPNDGLVSVVSAQHGVYKGTLVGVSHLDIINWTNRVKWMIKEQRFNAIAFYCSIADMLAEEGL